MMIYMIRYIIVSWYLVLGHCHGWLSFYGSLFGIGVMTALIGDVASAFGCTIGLKDSVTAIAIVAMGTSLPGSSWYNPPESAWLCTSSVDASQGIRSIGTNKVGLKRRSYSFRGYLTCSIGVLSFQFYKTPLPILASQVELFSKQ